MARSTYGGSAGDFLATISNGGLVRAIPGTLTFWSAETGGTQYTDLLLNGSPVSSIPVGLDGQVPTFQGPDGVGVMWADAGHGRVKLISDKTTAELASDSFIAGRVNDAASESRTALDTLYVAKAPKPTGVKATDEANVQPLVTAAQQTGGTVILQEGTYVMDLATAALDRQPRIIGQGEKLTKWDGTLVMAGTNAAFSGGYVSDLSMTGVRAAGVPFWELRGTVSVRWDRVNFAGTADIGILFHNRDSNQFTEMCAGQAHFGENIKKPLEYRVTSGNPSFHGCGLLDGSTINQKSTEVDPKVLIGHGAEPYNAPLSVTFWAKCGTPLIRHDGETTSAFYGDMKIELLPDDPYAVIVDPAGKELPFVGSLSRRGKQVRLGGLVLGTEQVTETGIARTRQGGAFVETREPGHVLWIGPDGDPEWVPKVRTNRATNPRVGNGTLRFSAYLGATIAQLATTTLGTTYALEVTTTSTTETQGFAYLEPGSNLAEGQVKTIAFDVYSPVDLVAFAGGRFGLSGSPGVVEVGERGTVGDVEYIAANTVHRVRRVVTVPPPNSGGTITHEGMYLRANTAADMPPVGTKILIGNVTIEDGITAGSRFNGGDGTAEWSGSADNSRSVQYPSQPSLLTKEVAYTPTLTNVTLGAGELVGYYSKVGKRVTGSVYLKCAADTVVSGTIRIGVPTDAPLVAGSKRRYEGQGWCNDFSATQRFLVNLLPNATTAFDVGVSDVSATYARRVPANATVPFTWAVDDELLVTFSYETL